MLSRDLLCIIAYKYKYLFTHVSYDRVCETEVRSRGRGSVRGVNSMIRYVTQAGGKIKTLRFVAYERGVKHDRNKRCVIFGQPLYPIIKEILIFLLL